MRHAVLDCASGQLPTVPVPDQRLNMLRFDAVRAHPAIAQLMQFGRRLGENSRARITRRVRAITVLLRQLMQVVVQLPHFVVTAGAFPFLLPFCDPLVLSSLWPKFHPN